MSAYQRCTEDQLIVCLRQGDYEAFTEIYNRYWLLLVDASYKRLHSREEAEEVVQDVFVNFYMRREELVLTSTLEAYLRTALKYKVIDAYRSQQRHYKHLDGIFAENNIAPLAPDEYIEVKELKEKITTIVHRLSDKCRSVFLMSRFEELSHQEIAERMDISVSTVKKHIHKALQALRSDFGNNSSHIVWIIALTLFMLK